jgi:hypothetical protein
MHRNWMQQLHRNSS